MKARSFTMLYPDSIIFLHLIQFTLLFTGLGEDRYHLELCLEDNPYHMEVRKVGLTTGYPKVTLRKVSITKKYAVSYHQISQQTKPYGDWDLLGLSATPTLEPNIVILRAK